MRGAERTIYAKAEHLNLTGSIKDRMALHMVRRAYATGALEPGEPIVEATSGNTGISFAAIGRALGHQVTLFMPDWLSLERRALIGSFGAEIESPTPNLNLWEIYIYIYSSRSMTLFIFLSRSP